MLIHESTVFLIQRHKLSETYHVLPYDINLNFSVILTSEDLANQIEDALAFLGKPYIILYFLKLFLDVLLKFTVILKEVTSWYKSILLIEIHINLMNFTLECTGSISLERYDKTKPAHTG